MRRTSNARKINVNVCFIDFIDNVNNVWVSLDGDLVPGCQANSLGKIIRYAYYENYQHPISSLFFCQKTPVKIHFIADISVLA